MSTGSARKVDIENPYGTNKRVSFFKINDNLIQIAVRVLGSLLDDTNNALQLYPGKYR